MKLSDFLRIRKKYGVKGILNYFHNHIFFDILNRTDTHYFYTTIDSSEYIGYTSSSTSEVKKQLKIIRIILGSQIHKYSFVDIGSGKGKVCMMAGFLRRTEYGFKRVIGVEVNVDLHEIAIRNQQLDKNSRLEFYNMDIADFDFESLGCSVLYISNALEKVPLIHVLDKIKSDCLLIYNNPVHRDVVLAQGFKLLSSSSGFHPTLATDIYANSNFIR